MTILTRRTLLKGTAAAGLALAAPAISYAAARPVATHGVQSGDVDASSGVIWAGPTVRQRLMDRADTELYRVTLAPAGA